MESSNVFILYIFHILNEHYLSPGHAPDPDPRGVARAPEIDIKDTGDLTFLLLNSCKQAFDSIQVYNYLILSSVSVFLTVLLDKQSTL